MAASVSPTDARCTSVTGEAVAGLMTVYTALVELVETTYSLSNPRNSSQSVTAALKAASSTAAMLS